MKEFTVREHEDGVKLERWLKGRFPHITRGLLEKSMRKGWIKVDKKKPNAKLILASEQVVSLAEYLCDVEAHTYEDAPKPKVEMLLHRENDEMRFRDMIIFEDSELIAINKPPGLAVQGGSKQKESIDSLSKSIATDAVSPRLVHRLDKDTSGVLIMAKTAKAATRLTKLFATKDVEKQYTALVINVPKPRKGKVDMPLIKSIKGKDSDIEKVQWDEDGGKDAVTLYEVTSNAAQKYAWVNLHPITGRTHQLRVHMAEIGHPIVGDGKYGGERAFRAGDNLDKKLHLHAASITIPKIGNKPLTVTAPLPPHMQKSWEWTGGD